jgi:hypothetical protein
MLSAVESFAVTFFLTLARRQSSGAALAGHKQAGNMIVVFGTPEIFLLRALPTLYFRRL